MSNVGCRIFTEVPRPPKELVERFRGLPVANIGDNMNRIYCVDSAIRSMNGKPMLGVAYTLHLPSGDNLLLHKAIEMAQPGDVLLLCSDGLTNAVPREQLEQLLRTGGFYDLPDLLIRTANENGGPDNITALLMGVEPLEVHHG